MTGSLEGKRIVLGVAGGIAAYKAVEVCRRLVDGGAHVIPVMTKGATEFVGPLTFSALASEPARTSLFSKRGGSSADPIPHVTLGRNCDLVVVAPATARVLAAYAAGLSSDLLTSTLIATAAPVLVCPAMHTEMWEHPATQDNLALLRRRGVAVVEPGTGRLAGGDHGTGRMAEPAEIVDAAAGLLGPRDFEGTSVLVTAGGTREPIDAVRVITNRSSGKQGTAIAAAAHGRGAKVTLVTTSSLPPPRGVEVVRVSTAADMESAVMSRSDGADVVVMAAAMADFRPKSAAGHKTKKSDGPPVIELVPTHDFLVDLGERRPPSQVLVGFAAETDDVVANATAKLKAKKLDLIVANDVSAPGAGFDHDTNEVTLITAESQVAVPQGTKAVIASAILDAVSNILETRRRSTR